MTADPPLYADLDGTVLSTDLLYESFLSAFKRSPWVAVQCVGWLAHGRARLKEELAARASIDVASLPYREAVLQFLREEKAKGRRIVLTTASWVSLAEQVARHLGLFDEVMATSREGNLKGKAKADRLAAASGEGCFDYIGDSVADLAVWRRCRHAYVVESSSRLSSRIPREVPVKGVFRPAGSESAFGTALRALRPHQWAKNFLLFVPLAAAHLVNDVAAVASAMQGFIAFCLFASAAYLVNDLLDLAADRAHPRKRARPLASGRLSIPAGAMLAGACLAAGAALAWPLPAAFQATLATYFALTLAYSLWLKRVAILDVISLAMLYTVRIVAGAFAIGVPISFWMLAFAMFLFFSLALVKRYAELVSLEEAGIGKAPGRGYGGHDAEVVLAIGSSSALVSALVLALYINGEAAKNLYARPEILWLLCPVLLYWIARIWLLAGRGQMDDDPVLFAVRDKASYVVAVLGAIVVWMAT
jgi:4-hydroxybenzoate polyprenyltransferase